MMLQLAVKRLQESTEVLVQESILKELLTDLSVLGINCIVENRTYLFSDNLYKIIVL